MKKWLIPCCLLLQFASQVRSQTPVLSAGPETSLSGMSAYRLSYIDSSVQDYISRKWLNGAVAIVYRNGKLAYYRSFGYNDIAARSPMQKDQIMRIASQSKAITSVAVMILYEQGKLLLDDPVSRYIPAFRNPRVIDHFNLADTTYTTVAAKREVTIRDLLTQSSGIGYAEIGSPEMNALYAKNGLRSGLGVVNASLPEKMKVLGSLPLFAQPGEKWIYGLNTDLLGCLVEQISGMSLENFMRTHIFIPLGMKDTYFNLPADRAGRLAKVYTQDDQEHIIAWGKNHKDIDPDYPTIVKHYFSGGAGLSSTAYDYAIFLQMMLNKGTYNGHRILSARSVEMMTSSQLDFPFNGTDYFGLGFELVSPKGSSKGPWNEGSFSWGGYFGTFYWADPKEKLVCLFMTQQSPNSHGDITEKFKALVYQAIDQPLPIQP